MATLDFLFQGQQPIAAPTGSSTSEAFPLWLQESLYNLSGAAAQVASQPYTPFPGPTVATPSAQTQQAWDLAQSNVGGYKPLLDKSQSMTESAAAPISAGDIQTFLNPYQSYITGALNRNLQQNLLPGIQDKFVSAGQSRSPQEAQITGQALQGTQTAIGESMAGAYQGALNSLLQQREQQRAAATQMGVLGTLGSQLGAVDVSQLASAGGQRDAVQQANLNAARAEFDAQQNWPYQNIGFLSNVIRGLPIQAAGQTSQTVGTTYAAPTAGASPFNTAVGAATNLVSALGWRRGGHVHRPPNFGALSRLRLAA